MTMDNSAVADGAGNDPANPLVAAESGLSFPVVGIGASAGGLRALTKVFEGLPAAPGMAFVVVMHLSPKHQSTAPEILQRVTRMPVMQVTEATRIERDRVYVIPPTHALTMVDGHLSLGQLERDRGRHIVIDLFFRTLAQAHKERAVAVVLSGTGADGSVGIAEIKEQGGVVIAQSTADAEFDGMPKSAIDTGKVDIELPASDIGQRLLDIWRNAQQIELPHPAEGLKVLPATAPESAEEALRKIMTTLLERTGHDFKHYKRATVLRRIERRLQISGLPHLQAYEQYLARTPGETAALLADMLIGVTNFFRDREAFEALERVVMPELLSEPFANQQLRVWVPGCSSGEEAYSLLMLLCQELGSSGYTRALQVFATDIDEAAIGRGRDAKYPESIVTDVPPALLRRYATREEIGYRITQGLREKVLFAKQNILRDPPFSRLDLVSCRNLLIYLEREVQREILQMFHFALRPDGFLFLGSSETVDATGRLFTPVDKKNRIYRANASIRSARTLPRLPLGTVERIVPEPEPRGASRRHADIAELHRGLLEPYSPPSILVRADGEIVHTSNAEPYLRFATGVPTQHVQQLLQPELRVAVRAAMYQAGLSNETLQSPNVRLQRDGQRLIVSVVVRPVQHADWPTPLMLLLFMESPDRSSTGAEADDGVSNPLVQQLETELQRKDTQLQRVIEQNETAVEDLRASNEELQAINEELRSATEELETSKEELQSTNEELITVNAELKSKVEEMAEINDDLQNLISSSDIATVFVDRDMRIKRFTPAATRLFSIIANDVGRSLLNITHRLDYDDLAADAAATFSSLRPVEREVSGDGRWYLVRILPYRTVEDRIDGAVLTFIDITSRRSAEHSMELDRERMQLIADSMPDFAIMTTDEQGRFTSWSAGAHRLFGYAEAETLGQPIDIIFTPEDRDAGMPQLEMRRARDNGKANDERWHQHKDGTRVFVSGVMSPMRLGRARGFAKIARDITTRHQEEAWRSHALTLAVSDAANAAQASQMKDEFLAIMSHELKHPLNLIQVNTQLLQALPEVRELKAVHKIGRAIQNTVRSQARIIDDLLDISRTRTGKLVLQLGAVDLAEALQSSLEWAERNARDQGLHFDAQIAEQLLPVHADAARIEQIAMNLLSNAFKFTARGGRVGVSLDSQGEEAVLRVTDSGRGIRAEFLPHIFEMFKQDAASTTSREQGGLGIGLALVHDLVQLHGGSIAAESAGAGLGSTFTVRLPIHESSDFSPLDGPVEPDALQGLRILFVDDSTDTVESFAALLRFEGAKVLAATSAAQALELAGANELDLLVSDIGMPGMDGYELVSELRRRAATKSLPAIAVTGYGRAQDEQQALAAGFDAHLSKPIDLRRLKALVRNLGIRPGGA